MFIFGARNFLPDAIWNEKIVLVENGASQIFTVDLWRWFLARMSGT